MLRILHIIDYLSAGGAARAMAAASLYGNKYDNYHHQVLGIRGAESAGIEMAQSYNMEYIDSSDPGQINTCIERADIVQVEWWNGSFLNEFLHRELPACRLLSWPHIAGDVDPQFIPKELVDFSDVVVASSPVCFSCPTLQSLSGQERARKVRLVYDCADFKRVEGITAVSHQGFNVGYIGTLHPCKMHSDYIGISALVDIPGIHFTLCGGEDVSWLQTQARAAGIEDRFHFKGYVENIRAEIAKFDVYGYPLCEDTYASAELNLQEVMYSGVPPVVFPYGGIRQLVFHDYTGLVVHSGHEYAQAIEYLYHNPAERVRLGENARSYAKQIFGAENAARRFHSIYQELMALEKRKRVWGCREDVPITKQRILLTDLWSPESSVIGAMRMLDSLQSRQLRDIFFTSICGQSLEAQMAANNEIAVLSALMSSCVQQYVLRYPSDPFLNIWQGLMQEMAEANDIALYYYSKAIEHGFSRSYVWSYIARTARKAGLTSLAAQAANRYSESRP